MKGWEKNKGKPRDRKEELKRIYYHEVRKIRKQLSIAKAKIERLEKKKQEDHEKRKEKWVSAPKRMQNHLCGRFD